MSQLTLIEPVPAPLLWTRGHITVRDEALIRMVIVAGVVFSRYVIGDSLAERYAIITLVADGLLQPRDVFPAFDVSVRSLYRWQKHFAEEGLSGLVDRKPGCKPLKMSRAMEASIRTLHAQGNGYDKIANRLGVSVWQVRQAINGVDLKGKVSAKQTPLFDWAEAPEPARPDVEPDIAKSEQTPPENGEPAPAPIQPASELLSGQDITPCIDPDLDEQRREVLTIEFRTFHLDTDPLNRWLDRFMASRGMLFGADPWFTCGHAIPSAGVLMAVPLLVQSGILETFQTNYPELQERPAFYGLRTIVLTLLFMALTRVKRPENLKEYDPVPLGRVLGLDRAPEVKTLRRKLSVLAVFKRGAVVMRELAERQLKGQDDLVGFLYIDGHVREYNGKGSLSKTYSVRRNQVVKATTDTFVNDADGEPLFLVRHELNQGLTQVLMDIALEIRALLGDGRRFTMVFDRGGWKPKLFAQLYELGVDVLTYRKGKVPQEGIEPGTSITVNNVRYSTCLDMLRGQVPQRSFFSVEHQKLAGKRVEFTLRERSVKMGKLTVQTENGQTRPFWMREVTRLCEGGDHETQVMSTRQDITGVEVLYRMFNRWRQENFFKYMREEYAIDGLVEYELEAVDSALTRPNPERRKLEKKRTKLEAEYRLLTRKYGELLLDNPTETQQTVAEFKEANQALSEKLETKRAGLSALKQQLAALPERISAEGLEQLSTERKQVTDTIKMAAYRLETELVRLLGDAYSRTEDEGRKLIVAAMRSPADIEPVGNELRVTLGRQSSAHRDRALAVLCGRLNDLNVCFPGTSLRLIFATSTARD